MAPNFNMGIRQNYRAGLRAGGLGGDDLRTAMQSARTSGALGGFRNDRQAMRGGMTAGGGFQGGGEDQLPPPAPTAPMGTPSWMKELYTPQTTGVNEPQPPGMPQTPLFSTFSNKDNPLASLGQNFNPSMGGFMPSERFQKPEDFYRSMWDSLGGDYQKHFQNTYQGDPWIQFLTGGGGEGVPVPNRGGANARKAANMSSLFGALR